LGQEGIAGEAEAELGPDGPGGVIAGCSAMGEGLGSIILDSAKFIMEMESSVGVTSRQGGCVGAKDWSL